MKKDLAGMPGNFVADRSTLIVVICIALAAGIFTIDVTSLPLGVAAGVAYVAVILISLWLPKWRHVFIVSGLASVLTILGFLFSEPAGIPWMVVANRLLALCAIWLTALAGGWLVFVKRKVLEDALQKAEHETDRARNAKSRFLETTSNDMRQHLQTLSLLTAALNKTVMEPRTRKMCKKQGEAVAHLGDLLNSILDFSELELGHVATKITQIPVEEIFQRLHNEFKGQADAKGLVLRFDSQDEVAYSDRFLLMLIIRSLISNAVCYTNQGEVNVFCRREPGGLRITVKDTGIGISADKLARIFDEFYRIDDDPIGTNSGRGLGLSVVESSVNLLGTKVDVESQPGQGSSFSVVVPAAHKMPSSGYADQQHRDHRRENGPVG